MELGPYAQQNLHNLLKFQGLYASGKLGSAGKTSGNMKNRDPDGEIQSKTAIRTQIAPSKSRKS
jgi:hypothetical protein